MKTNICILALVAAGMMSFLQADRSQAQEFRIDSFDGSGRLSFETVSTATWYRVEWATSPSGPWMRFGDAAQGLDFILPTGSGSVTCSVPMCYRVVAGVEPQSMMPIPAGAFTMGDPLDDSSTAMPTHGVDLDAFYIDRYEVTKALWDAVYAWGVTRGYAFDSAGPAKGGVHPVHSILWHDCLKWCNARSEMEGRIPAYYLSSEQTNVYRTGNVNVQSEWVKWDEGYRLPTEAEWEKAARGGSNGHRFPWNDVDTIDHTRANYWSYWSYDAPYYSYDTATNSGYHLTYATGGMPYTSPVGSFAPNGYGLYDMAGNLWEWCWDWYSDGYYSTSPLKNPLGPSSGSSHVIRGGSWGEHPLGSSVFCRLYNNPTPANNRRGFRTVLPAN